MKTLEDMATDHFENVSLVHTGPFRCAYCGKKFRVEYDWGGFNPYPDLYDGERVCLDCIHEFEEQKEEESA